MNPRHAAPDPMVCHKCGRPHGRCKAHNRAGHPCGNRPLRAQSVCRSHGGRAPQALTKARERIAREEAEHQVATLGLLRDVDAPTALLEELQRTAHMVDVYIEQCQAAAPDQLAGILRALMDERRHLVSVAVAALRARVEEASQGRGVYVVEVSWPVRDARTQSVPLVVGETIDVEGDATNGE